MPEFDIEQVDFSKLQDPKSGEFLVPAVIRTRGQVAMLGFMNREALAKTIATRLVTFFSRNSGKLWTKGETSGNFLNLVTITLDCDNDSLLVDADPVGAVCHTGAKTCFEPAPTMTNIPMQFPATVLVPRVDITEMCDGLEAKLGPSWQEEMFF